MGRLRDLDRFAPTPAMGRYQRPRPALHSFVDLAKEARLGNGLFVPALFNPCLTLLASFGIDCFNFSASGFYFLRIGAETIANHFDQLWKCNRRVRSDRNMDRQKPHGVTHPALPFKIE